MPSKQTAPLYTALAKKKDSEFIRALQRIDTNEWGPFPERRKPLGMVWGLAAFHRALTEGGIRGFLLDEWGAGFHETERWCREVGAGEAAAYLSATAALFPKGKVPVANDRRRLIAEKIERTSEEGQPPFAALDREYAAAKSSLAAAVRKYVEKNLGEIERAIDVSFNPPTPAHARAADRKASKLLKRLAHESTLEQARETRRAASAKKAGRATPKTADPMMVAFVDALIGFSADTWDEVISRYDKLPKRARDFSVAEIDSLRFDGQMKRLFRPERFTARVKAALAERDRVKAKALTALPVEKELNGRTVPFRLAAAHATHQAWAAIQLHEWIVGNPPLEKAARTAYAPFIGLVPLPVLGTGARKRA